MKGAVCKKRTSVQKFRVETELSNCFEKGYSDTQLDFLQHPYILQPPSEPVTTKEHPRSGTGAHALSARRTHFYSKIAGKISASRALDITWNKCRYP